MKCFGCHKLVHNLCIEQLINKPFISFNGNQWFIHPHIQAYCSHIKFYSLFKDLSIVSIVSIQELVLIMVVYILWIQMHIIMRFQELCILFIMVYYYHYFVRTLYLLLVLTHYSEFFFRTSRYEITRLLFWLMHKPSL